MSLPKLILRELEKGPLTYRQVADVLGAKYRSTHEALMRMHRRGDPIHIKEWVRSWNHYIPVFAYGHGIDEPRPEKMTNSERCRRYKQRKGMIAPHCPDPLLAIRLGLKVATGFTNPDVAYALGWRGRGRHWEFHQTTGGVE